MQITFCYQLTLRIPKEFQNISKEDSKGFPKQLKKKRKKTPKKSPKISKELDFKNLQFITSHLKAEIPFGLVFDKPTECSVQ